jgi:hypothetical protein
MLQNTQYCQISMLPVNYCMIYNYQFTASSDSLSFTASFVLHMETLALTTREML